MLVLSSMRLKKPEPMSAPVPVSETRLLKLLFGVTSYPTSSDTAVTNQVIGLLGRGHDVRILARGGWDEAQVQGDIVQNGLLERTSYRGRRMGRLADLVTLARGAGRVGVATAIQLIRTPSDPAAQLLRTANFLAEHGPFDVFNVHFGSVARRLIGIKDLFPAMKFVVSFHGNDFSGYVRQNGVDVYDEVFRRADLILTLSEYSRDCLIALGCPVEKLVVHPLGINLDRFDLLPPRPATGPVRLISVARLVEKKGHRHAIEAFARVAADHPELRYDLVGDGPLRPQIEQQIQQLPDGIRQRITLHGWQSQDGVAALLAEIDLFVLPSVTSMRWADQEDTPNALIEAQARGLPVISTVHAGIPEIVRDGETGWLVPERNVPVLEAVLRRALAERERWTGMGRAGRAWVSTTFAEQTQTRRFEQMMDRLLTLPDGASLGLHRSAELTEDESVRAL